jgi:predicted nucleotidyltransferase
MFRIALVYRPSLKNIYKKHFVAIKQIIGWCQAIHKSFNCKVYGIYVRGSVAHGTQNNYSDMDIAILLHETDLLTILQFEDAIDALLSLYIRSFSIEIKVYGIDRENNAEPATIIQGSLRNEIKKHINFDLSANGICIWGIPIKDNSTIFASPNEFIRNNQIILGNSIEYLIHQMLSYPFFNSYYPLIKKCIKLSAIVNFKTKSGYIAPIKACFEYTIKNDKKIKKELCLIFNYLEKDISKLPLNLQEELKEAIIKIAKRILDKV